MRRLSADQHRKGLKIMKLNTKMTEEKMQKSVIAFENNLSTIRASQANSAVVSRVTFDYYGAPTRLVDMASVAPVKLELGEVYTSDGKP